METQELRRLDELKAAQSRLPTGMKAAWARLTGVYQRQVQELVQEAQISKTPDLTETQALIDKHLSERRVLEQELEQELEFLRTQHAFGNEFHQSSRRSSDQTYSVDPRQPLVLPREAIPFTAKQLKRKPDLILGYISDKQVCFSHIDVMRGLIEFIDDPLELRLSLDIEPELFTPKNFTAKVPSRSR